MKRFLPLIVLSLFVYLLVVFPAGGQTPTKPYADLSDGDTLTGTWLMGTFNTIYLWAQRASSTLDIQSASMTAHIASATGVHGLAAGVAVVGASSTQTLTNKSISGEQINSGTVADARIASTIARDSEVASAVSTLLDGVNTWSARQNFGDAWFTGDPRSYASFGVYGTPGVEGIHFYDTASSPHSLRWVIRKEGSQTGSDTGSDLYLSARDDAGNAKTVPVRITRAGVITLSSALAVSSGGTNATSFTASQLVQMNSGGTALESSGKTVPSGNIVGTTDTQTLTNKTIGSAGGVTYFYGNAVFKSSGVGSGNVFSIYNEDNGGVNQLTFAHFDNTYTSVPTYINSYGQITSYAVYARTSGSSANVYIDSDGYFWRSTSSLRYKKDVTDIPSARSDLTRELRPITYRAKTDPATAPVHVGLIAEEIHDAGLTELVVYDDQGRPDAVEYDRLAVLLLDRVNRLEARVAELEGEQ